MCIINYSNAVFLKKEDANTETIEALRATYKISEYDVENIKLWVTNGKPYDGISIAFFPKSFHQGVQVPPLCKPFRNLYQFQMNYPVGVVWEKTKYEPWE